MDIRNAHELTVKAILWNALKQISRHGTQEELTFWSSFASSSHWFRLQLTENPDVLSGAKFLHAHALLDYTLHYASPILPVLSPPLHSHTIKAILVLFHFDDPGSILVGYTLEFCNPALLLFLFHCLLPLPAYDPMAMWFLFWRMGCAQDTVGWASEGIIRDPGQTPFETKHNLLPLA